MGKQEACPHCRNGFFENRRFGQDVECVNGVLIDIDEFTEGRGRDVIRPVAPCHPMWERQVADPDGETWENDSIDRLNEVARHRIEATPAVDREAMEAGIRTAIWNAARALGIGQDVAITLVQKAMEQPAIMALPPVKQSDGWQDISTAPKDGTTIWAIFHAEIYPRIRPSRTDLEVWNGKQVPLRHPGIFEDPNDKPFDVGWSIAAPVGAGGFPDEWIAGWQPLPAPLAIRSLDITRMDSDG